MGTVFTTSVGKVFLRSPLIFTFLFRFARAPRPVVFFNVPPPSPGLSFRTFILTRTTFGRYVLFPPFVVPQNLSFTFAFIGGIYMRLVCGSGMTGVGTSSFPPSPHTPPPVVRHAGPKPPRHRLLSFPPFVTQDLEFSSVFRHSLILTPVLWPSFVSSPLANRHKVLACPVTPRYDQSPPSTFLFFAFPIRLDGPFFFCPFFLGAQQQVHL